MLGYIKQFPGSTSRTIGDKLGITNRRITSCLAYAYKKRLVARVDTPEGFRYYLPGDFSGGLFEKAPQEKATRRTPLHRYTDSELLDELESRGIGWEGLYRLKKEPFKR